MGDQTDRQAERISGFCGWVAVAVVILLAIVVCIAIVAFAVWLNV